MVSTLHQALCSTFYKYFFFSLIPTATLTDKCYYYPYFILKETEAEIM